MEDKKAFFDKERGERELYTITAPPDVEIPLPLTRDGFEALIERSAACHGLPVDDSIRSVLAGWIHHIPNDQHTTTINKVAGILYKSISNALTYTIDQEIKAKNRAIQEAQNAKFAQEMAERQKTEKILKAEAKRQRKGAPLKVVKKASPDEKTQ